jgi:hypothetical protein
MISPRLHFALIIAFVNPFLKITLFTEELMNDELKGMWKDAVVAYFK